MSTIRLLAHLTPDERAELVTAHDGVFTAIRALIRLENLRAPTDAHRDAFADDTDFIAAQDARKRRVEALRAARAEIVEAWEALGMP